MSRNRRDSGSRAAAPIGGGSVSEASALVRGGADRGRQCKRGLGARHAREKGRVPWLKPLEASELHGPKRSRQFILRRRIGAGPPLSGARSTARVPRMPRRRGVRGFWPARRIPRRVRARAPGRLHGASPWQCPRRFLGGPWELLRGKLSGRHWPRPRLPPAAAGATLSLACGPHTCAHTRSRRGRKTGGGGVDTTVSAPRGCARGHDVVAFWASGPRAGFPPEAVRGPLGGPFLAGIQTEGCIDFQGTWGLSGTRPAPPASLALRCFDVWAGKRTKAFLRKRTRANSHPPSPWPQEIPLRPPLHGQSLAWAVQGPRRRFRIYLGFGKGKSDTPTSNRYDFRCLASN